MTIQRQYSGMINSANGYNTYSARFKGWRETTPITPNIELNEGIRPDSFVPAPYLKVVRYDDYTRSWVVIGAGKPVCTDSNSFLVPAGLRRQAQMLLDMSIAGLTFSGGALTGNTLDFSVDYAGATLDRYGADDTTTGMLNSRGVVVTTNEPVIYSLFTAAAYSATPLDIHAIANPFSSCLGIVPYDVKQAAGRTSSYNSYNPATYQYHNLIEQTAAVVLCDYVIQLPVEPYNRAQASFCALPAATSDADVTLDISAIGAVDVSISGSLTGYTTTIQSSFVVTKNGVRLQDKGSALVAGDEDIYYYWTDASPDKVFFLGNAADTFLVDFIYQVSATYSQPYAGLTTFRGTPTVGGMVTYDITGNFIMDPDWSFTAATDLVYDGHHGFVTATSALDAGIVSGASLEESLGADFVLFGNRLKAKSAEVLGQILRYDVDFPKDYLDRVRTAFDPNVNGVVIDPSTGAERTVDRMPGSATGGLPANVYLAGGDADTGVVHINLITR